MADAGSNAITVNGQLVSEAKSTKSRAAPASASSDAVTGAVSANNAFAVDLYAQLRAGPASGNLLTSPISASLALTMTYAGARGTTATQMATALHYGSAASTIFDGQNALSQALDARGQAALAADAQIAQEGAEPAPSPSDYQLQVVNSVWGQTGYAWQAPFLDILAEDYGTGVYLQDFADHADPARVLINDWVSAETSDRINNLLPEGAIDSNTVMVLVNAIHLKLPWATTFDAFGDRDRLVHHGRQRDRLHPVHEPDQTTCRTSTTARRRSSPCRSRAARSRSSSPCRTATWDVRSGAVRHLGRSRDADRLGRRAAAGPEGLVHLPQLLSWRTR